MVPGLDKKNTKISQRIEKKKKHKNAAYNRERHCEKKKPRNGLFELFSIRMGKQRKKWYKMLLESLVINDSANTYSIVSHKMFALEQT